MDDKEAIAPSVSNELFGGASKEERERTAKLESRQPCSRGRLHTVVDFVPCVHSIEQS